MGFKLTIDRQKWCTGTFGAYAFGYGPEDENPDCDVSELYCCATGWLGMALGAEYATLEQATKTTDFLPEEYNTQGARSVLANIIDINDDYTDPSLEDKEKDIIELFSEIDVDCEFVGEKPSTGRLPDAS